MPGPFTSLDEEIEELEKSLIFSCPHWWFIKPPVAGSEFRLEAALALSAHKIERLDVLLLEQERRRHNPPN